jgi:hypothetical protein
VHLRVRSLIYLLQDELTWPFLDLGRLGQGATVDVAEVHDLLVVPRGVDDYQVVVIVFFSIVVLLAIGILALLPAHGGLALLVRCHLVPGGVIGKGLLLQLGGVTGEVLG